MFSQLGSPYGFFFIFCEIPFWVLTPSFWILFSSETGQVYLILSVKSSTGLAPLHIFVKKVWKYVCKPKTLWGFGRFAVHTSAATALECCFTAFCRYWQHWGDGIFSQQGPWIMTGDFFTQVTSEVSSLSECIEIHLH